METLSFIGNLITFNNVLAIFIGTFIGIILGALPGCTPSLGLAIFIPITYAMDPVTALIYLGSIYAGGMYGGTITAILINVPGTAAAAAATIEGYKMTQHGRASEALTEAACSSLFGNLFGLLGQPAADIAHADDVVAVVRHQLRHRSGRESGTGGAQRHRQIHLS